MGRRNEAFAYHVPPIMAHAPDNERQQSVLRPVVERFLRGERQLSPTETFALRAYMVRWCDRKKQALDRLAQEAPKLELREEYIRWFSEARFYDLDPVE